jgi:hypothetical protein
LAAAGALAGQEDPAVTKALLDRVRDDDDTSVRFAAVHALAGREAPEDLLLLAKEARSLSRARLLEVINAAEQLMIQHDRRIEPAMQPAVRAAMGWLTRAALADGIAAKAAGEDSFDSTLRWMDDKHEAGAKSP